MEFESSSTFGIRKLEQQFIPEVPDFVEGLMFSENQGLVITGDMVTELGTDAPFYSNHGYWKRFYFEHVRETFLRSTTQDREASVSSRQERQKDAEENNHNDYTIVGVEYMELEDYLHRHDRGVFWTVPLKFPFTKYFLVRAVFGWLFDRKFRQIFPDRAPEEELRKESRRVVQDAVVPSQVAAACLREFREKIFGEVWPIWLCPLRSIHRNHPWRGSGLQPLLFFPPDVDYYIDIGVYGRPAHPEYTPITAHRKMEDLLRRRRGFVGAYAVSYTTPEEFWFSHETRRYHHLRTKFRAWHTFLDLYSKIGGGGKVARFRHSREAQENLETARRLEKERYPVDDFDYDEWLEPSLLMESRRNPPL